MTFQTAVWAVDGAEIDGQLMRAQLAAATYDSQGIVQPDHLRVHELATPADGVRIDAGSGVISGVEAPFQGSYFANNVGVHELNITPTGSSARSDLVIARAEDPTASSEWTQDPSTGVVFPRVVEDVLSDQTQVPVGDSAIPLARIDIPASTSVITDSMIVDLRRPLILNPFFQESIAHGSGTEAVGTGEIYTDWPASATFVDVPTWATRMDLHGMIHSVRANANEGDAPNNIFGNVRHMVDGSAEGQIGEWNHEWPAGVSRQNIINAHTISAVPYRGTRVEVKLQINVQGKSGNEILQADNGTHVLHQIFFRQTSEFNLTG